MKNKLLVLILVFGLLFTTSCKKKNNNNNQEPHTHCFVEGKCECGEVDPNYVPPHTHSFVDGKCECGEVDPNYVPPHTHNFVEGKCECGEVDPNYVPPHVHNFVEGKCECGEVDPNYVPPHVHNFVEGKCECGEVDPNYNVPLEAPIATMDKEYYVIGETIGFNLENYDNLDLLDIAFDTTNGVRVGKDGTITARRTGEYTVTLSVKEDPSLYIAIEFVIYKSSFQLDATTQIIAVDDKVEIWVFDFDGLYETTEDDFIYTVDDENIATIENRVLTAKKIGDVNVTATSKYNSNVKQSIKIRVGDPNTEFMIRPSKELGKIMIGEILPMTLTANENPSDFVWLCDDAEIARATKYDTALEVAGVKEGSAFITCYKESDPLVNAKYKITVKDEMLVDYRKRLVELAYEQIGIKEGLKPNGDYDNDTKFGKWYGNNGEPWCATFVSWCWYHAGLSNDILLKYQGCTAGMQWCKEQGIFKYKEEYTPTTGDIVFFQSGSTYNGVSSHTGIVAHCDGEYIYTIEGNRSNRVDVWRIKVDNTRIIGYGIPNYPGLTEYDDFSWIKEQQPDGSYLWTNVSAGDSTT